MADAERPLRRVGVGGRTVEFAPNGLTPARAEAVIAWALVERLYVFDPLDRLIARFRGTVDWVDLSDDLMARTGALGLYGESVLADHMIVPNHPPRGGADPVVSFPPSALDLLRTVERDLRSLVVLSGGVRYEVRRPGLVWPFDESLLAETLDLIDAELETEDLGRTRRGSASYQARVLERLRTKGVIDYEVRTIATGL